MTNQDVEEIKGHFDRVTQELRTELRNEFRGEFALVRTEAGAVADHLKAELAEVRHYTGVVVEDLRSEIRAVAEGVALANERIDHVDLRVEGLASEVGRGFAGVRTEIRRIEAQQQRGA